METIDQILKNLSNNPNHYNAQMNEEEHYRLDIRKEL